MWGKVSCLRKQHALQFVVEQVESKETTRWQGLAIEPPTFRSEVQRVNHYTTAPPPGSMRSVIFDSYTT